MNVTLHFVILQIGLFEFIIFALQSCVTQVQLVQFEILNFATLPN